MNSDGRIDAADALLILQESAGYDVIAQSGPWWEMTLPDVLIITRTGCTVGGACLPATIPAGFYSNPGGVPEIVTTPDTTWFLVAHELCHAHQWAVSEGDWLESDEGKAFARASADPTNTIRPLPSTSLVEHYALACSLYYVNPQVLFSRAPVLYEFFVSYGD